MQTEDLTGENKWKAEGHGLQDTRKGSLFQELPPVLQLHLKRFNFDYQTWTPYKVCSTLSFGHRRAFSHSPPHRSQFLYLVASPASAWQQVGTACLLVTGHAAGPDAAGVGNPSVCFTAEGFLAQPALSESRLPCPVHVPASQLPRPTLATLRQRCAWASCLCHLMAGVCMAGVCVRPCVMYM